MKKEKIILLLLFLTLFIINYSFLDSALVKAFQDYETGIVERVIDGDTIAINKTSIRLLGINAPEKGEPFFEDSKEFLEKEILNQEVQLHFGKTRYDKYRRKLAYIFIRNKNINLESVKHGYSNYYFPSGEDKYSSQIKEAWNFCLSQNKNLCKKSSNSCLVLENWYIEEQKIILQNVCSFPLNLNEWTIKDEGRKKYIFVNKTIQSKEKIILTSKDWKEDYVWTKTGDSIFIRDSNNELILFQTY